MNTKPANQPTYDEHPSYGVATISRQTNSSRRLFGSSDSGPDYINLEISTARLVHYPGALIAQPLSDQRLITVNMSVLQFTELIACHGGTGVPCTITWHKGELIQEPPEPTTRREIIEKAFEKEMQHLGRDCDALLAQARTLSQKPNVNKGDREALVKFAESLVSRLTAKTPYVISHFTETIELMCAETKINSAATTAPPKATTSPSS